MQRLAHVLERRDGNATHWTRCGAFGRLPGFSPPVHHVTASPVFRGCLLALALFGAVVAQAATTYTGDAPVESQADAERGKALQAALAQIVVQLTGDADAPSRSDVARSIASASQKPLQFQYRRDGSGALSLVAQFDAERVNTLLRQHGLSPLAGGGEALDWTPSEATVRVDGIRSAVDFARLMRFLTTLDLVRSAAPQQADGESVRIRLSLAADLPRFLDAVNASSLLRVVDTPAGNGVDATLGFAR